MKKTILGVCLFLGGLLSAGLWTVAEALAHLGGGGPLTWYLSGSSDLPVLLLLAAMAVAGLAILVVQACREWIQEEEDPAAGKDSEDAGGDGGQ